MKTLNIFGLENSISIADRDQTLALTLSSPALLALQDFRQAQPMTIDDNTPLEEARAVFHRAHVKLKLALDRAGNITGILVPGHLSKQNELLKQADGFDRKQLTVKDLMIPVQALEALDIDQLQHATVANLLNTLQVNGLQYCLVTNTTHSSLIGLISAEELASRVHAPIKLRRAPSFVELFTELHVENTAACR